VDRIQKFQELFIQTERDVFDGLRQDIANCYFNSIATYIKSHPGAEVLSREQQLERANNIATIAINQLAAFANDTSPNKTVL